MGMAASQSRFLALTARKSNTEYQGQQVNQQRTTLSNESSNLYNQMLALEVPTPPSSSKYYNTTYSFSDGYGATYSFTKFKLLDSEKNVEIQYSVPGYKLKNANPISNKTNSIGLSGSAASGFSGTIDGSSITKVADKSSLEGYSSNTGNGQTYEHWYNQDIYTYTKTDTINGESVKTQHYLSSSQLEDLLNGNSVHPVTAYETNVTKTAIVDAELKTNDSGRLTAITITGTEDEKFSKIKGKTISLDISRVDDEDAYDEAMKEYEYQKALYDKKVEDINMKTASIQAKDKNLELKLKQLDTEQNAIQTEMEAVQKVIEKNVEDTFKTFA